MFGYLIQSKKFTIALGQFISREVVKHNGKLRTVEEVNNMDRHELARKFYDSISSSLLEGATESWEVREDIAIYIDNRIPKTYIK